MFESYTYMILNSVINVKYVVKTKLKGFKGLLMLIINDN